MIRQMEHSPILILYFKIFKVMGFILPIFNLSRAGFFFSGVFPNQSDYKCGWNVRGKRQTAKVAEQTQMCQDKSTK